MIRFGLLCCILSSGILFASCGGTSNDGPKTYNVSGTVALDGEPVLDGAMVFMDPEKKQKSYGAKIVGGEFSTSMTKGKKKVLITATRISKDKMSPDPSGDGPPVPAEEQYIPAKYNKKTTLEANISADGPNKLTFDLKSK